MKFITSLSLILFLSSSCMTNRHTIGDGPVGARGKTRIYSSAKQGYLFFGLIPLGRPEPAHPSDNNYQIKTGYNVGDAILGTLTLGIVTFRTVRIIVHTEIKAAQGTDAPVFLIGDVVVFKQGKIMQEGKILGIDGNKAVVEYTIDNVPTKETISLGKLTRIER